MIIINTNLRELRKANRISQEQLANEIGTCRKTYFNKPVDEIF